MVVRACDKKNALVEGSLHCKDINSQKRPSVKFFFEAKSHKTDVRYVDSYPAVVDEMGFSFDQIRKKRGQPKVYSRSAFLYKTCIVATWLLCLELNVIMQHFLYLICLLKFIS